MSNRYNIGGIEVVNGVRKGKYFFCQTIELLQRSRRIQLQSDIATMQSDNIVLGLKDSLRKHVESVFRVSDAVALLDMLCSFTQLSAAQNYIRPIITNTLVLKAARNPIVELRKENYVPNDVYSGNLQARFQVITGGNMAGKTTFLKGIALVQILSQMGCFVPAEFASIPPCDRIFTRLSTEDKPESNLGAFGVEMREMDLILRYVLPLISD